MDNLKFRIWHPASEQYLDAVDCDIDCNGNVWLVNYLDDVPDDYVNITNDIVVERCTGFSDKNGNLIYDGDRVRFGIYTGTVMFGTYSALDCGGDSAILGFYIEWDDPKCMYRKEMGFWGKKEIEIIGTVHEKDRK